MKKTVIVLVNQIDCFSQSDSNNIMLGLQRGDQYYNVIKMVDV